MKKYSDQPVGISGFTQLFHNTFVKHESTSKKSTAITYMTDNHQIEEYSYEDIKNRIDMWISRIGQFGIEHGDRVAIIAPSTPNTILTILALALYNITVVILDHDLPVDEINRCLAYSDTRGVFTTKTFFNSLSTEIIGKIPVFDIELSDFKPKLFPTSVERVKCGSTSDKNYDIIAILFSSGTSSSMKGVMITYDSVILSYQKQKHV